MELAPAVWAALVGAAVAVIGWFANHLLTAQREEFRRRTEAQFNFVERQIEQLYGPLAAELYAGRQTFLDLLDSLGGGKLNSLDGRKFVFDKNDFITPEDLKIWLFWAEADFLPRNERIKALLMSKAHLIEGPVFPDSYLLFLNHCNSWAINHRRWKEQQIEYSWHSKINWPESFENEVIATFQALNRRHANLLGTLTSNVSFTRAKTHADRDPN